MWRKLSQSISSRPALVTCLKVLGWAALIVGIAFCYALMQSQSISFVYNAF